MQAGRANISLLLAATDFSYRMLEREQTLRLAHVIGMQGFDVSLFVGRSHLTPEEILSNPSKSAEGVSSAA